MRRLLILIALSVLSAQAQLPPAQGLHNNTTLTTHDSWSDTQPYPSSCAVSTISRTSNVVTANFSAACTGLRAGGWAKLSGVADSTFNIANSAIASATQSGTTISLVLGTATNVTVGERVGVDGMSGTSAGLMRGWFVVAGVADSTHITLTARATRTISSGVTGGTLHRSVQISTVNGGLTQATWVQTASDASSTGGTLTGAMAIMAVTGSTYTDPVFGSAVETLVEGSDAPIGTSGQAFYKYSSVAPCDISHTHCVFGFGSGRRIVARATPWVGLFDIGGEALHAKWSTTEALTIYRKAGSPSAIIQKCVWNGATYVCTNTYDFSNGSIGGRTDADIGIGGPCGTGDEGSPRKRASNNHNLLPLIATRTNSTPGVCPPNTDPRDLLAFDTDSGTILTTVDIDAYPGQLDHVKVWPTALLMLRSSESAQTGFSAARSGTTITYTRGGGFGTVNVGEKIRAFNCSNADFNRFGTVTAKTATTISIVDAAVTTTNATGCVVGTQWTGHTRWNTDGTINNIVAAIGSHNGIGVDSGSNDAIVIGQTGATPNSAIGCPSTVVVKVKADVSAFIEGTSYIAAHGAALCFAGLNGASISDLQQGWSVLFDGGNEPTGAPESTIASNWPAQQAIYDNNALVLQITDCYGAVGSCPTNYYQVAHARNRNLAPSGCGSTCPYGYLDADLSRMYWMADAGLSGGYSVYSIVFNASAAPTLTSISPSEGTQGTVVPVTLAGTGFSAGGATVNVSGTGATVSNTVVVNDTSITADFTIAAGAATGGRNVSVTTSGGTSSNVTFLVNASAAPTLSGVSPASCTQGRTATVTLTGTNFDASAVINVSGSNVTATPTFISATTIIADFTCAVSAAVGTRTVSVTTDAGTSGTQNFTVLAKPGFGGLGRGVPR